MNPKIAAFKEQLAPSVPDIYYHKGNSLFMFMQTDGDDRNRSWVGLSQPVAEDTLALSGIRATKLKGEEFSPAEELLMRTRMNGDRSVSYAGPMAGYPRGFRNLGAFNALVTESPKIPKAVKGDWSYIRAIIDGLLGEVQSPYFYAWCKYSRYMLINTMTRGMPALVFCGPKNCGKSFLQTHIITPLLGGRMAKANAFLTGGSQFNGDMIGAEHLVLSDERSDTSTMSRRDHGNMIKLIVAEEDQRLRAMYSEAFVAKLFWRLTIALNDELENIMRLPLMDGSMEDKLMLFYVNKFDWPVQAVTPDEFKEFEEAVHAQVAAFCWWLDNEFTIPHQLTLGPDGKPARWGLACFHHDRLMRHLTEVSPEFRMLELIRQCYFTAPSSDLSGRKPTNDDSITMPVLEMEQGLKSPDSPVHRDADRLLTTGTRLVTFLSRLSQKYPDFVFQTRNTKGRFWTIRDIDTLISRIVS